MAKTLLVWLALTFATALFCMTSAAVVNVKTVRSNHQSAASAKHHAGRIGKRSFFAPNQMAGWYETLSDDGQGILNLGYCWKEAGYAQYKQWIKEALDETWHRLKVVMFRDVGLCADRPADDPNHPLEVSFWNDTNCYSMFQTGKAVLLEHSFSPSCKPECTVSTQAEERCIKKAAVHEFEHALGLEHEQIRTDTPIQFTVTRCLDNDEAKKEARYYLQTQHWSLGAWDERSVMNYCSPDYFNFSNYQPLSIGDRAAVLSLYGRTSYFNSSCNAWSYKNNPLSAACTSAVQRYCETVHENTKNVIGIVRNLTSNGLNVTCFKADFIQPIRDVPAGVSSALVVVEDKQQDGNSICRNWAHSNVPDKYRSQRYFDVPIDIGGIGRAVVCIESGFHGLVGVDDLAYAAKEANDFRCLKALHSYAISAATRNATLSCVATVDRYCDIWHKNVQAGRILKYHEATATLEVVCFEALSKIELFSAPVD